MRIEESSPDGTSLHNCAADMVSFYIVTLEPVVEFIVPASGLFSLIPPQASLNVNVISGVN